MFVGGVSSVSSALPNYQNDELTKLTEPIQDDLLSDGLREPTKLTKLLSNEHVALFRAIECARPNDVSDTQWRTAMRGLEAFLVDGHGDEAERLGWPRDELYRIRQCGLASTCAALRC